MIIGGPERSLSPFGPAIGILLAALGTLALGAAGASSGPDLFLIPVAAAARFGNPVFAMLVGLAAGLGQDTLMVPERLLGLHAASKTLIAYLLATLGTRTIVDKAPAVGALLAASVIFESAALSLVLWVLRGEALWPAVVPLLTRAAVTGLAGALLWAASRVPWVARWRERRRRRLS